MRCPTSDWLTLAGIIVLLMLSAVLAMAETSFVRINRIRAMTLAGGGRARARDRLLKLMEQPETALNLVLLLVLICQLSAATLVGVLVERKFGGYGLLVGTAVEVVAFFVLRRGRPQDLRHPAHRDGRRCASPVCCGPSPGSRRCGSSPAASSAWPTSSSPARA